ncbi:ABC transporter ATP-binding protein [Dolosicoccus paucivorans]|nr:ABC transporter ATP-binding protein [Dolosicoccus paucivorans]
MSEEKQTSHPERRSQKPKNFGRSISRLLKELMNYPKSLLAVFITAILSTIFNIVGPKQLGRATTALFEGVMAKIQGTGNIDFNRIGRILLIVLALYVISAVFGMIQGWIMSTMTQRITYSLRQRLIAKIDRLPMAYFESRPYGEVLSRITNDIDTLGNGLNQSITTVITSVLTMIGILFMMFTISPLMVGVSLLIIPLSLLLVSTLMKMSQKYFRAQQQGLGIINGQVEEIYSGQQVVQAYNQEEATLEQFEIENASLEESAMKSQFFSGAMYPVMNFVSNLGYVGVVVTGAYLAIQGAISVGDIQAFTQYVRRFTLPITQMAQVVTQLQSMAAAGERVYEFLDEEEIEETAECVLDVSQVEGHVTFDHVQFGYEPGQVIISDFSQEVKPGQKIALVGPTGAGKSTMVKLLMRFYDVNQGAIYLDDVNIQDYTRQSYRQAIAMVLQDTWLFKGTIRENIRYGRLDATDEEVEEAAKNARVHRYIMQLPNGYDFELNDEATNISQGQKQLITIARALLSNRPILILDEATSSVDTRTEILIQEAMDELMKGRTSFVIAHRLSTIRDADVILYMEQGDIVEKGSHEELMKLNEKYAKLYNSQFI